jgi:DNA processing protein
VVVIEAPFRSGALVTARHAVEQNREVFVVPGPLSNHNYQGSHRLIRSGAALVTSIEDICEEINLPFAPAEELARRKIKLTPEQDKIFNFVKSAGRPVNVDNIIETTKINPSQVNQIIAFLVINDMIKESTGKYHL